MGRKRGIQVGAAAFALGVSLAGPQIAIASADEPESDQPSLSAGAPTRPESTARSPRSAPRATRNPGTGLSARPGASTRRVNDATPVAVPDSAASRLTRPKLTTAAPAPVTPEPTPRAEPSERPAAPAPAAALIAVPEPTGAPAAAAAIPRTLARDCALCRAATAPGIDRTFGTAINRAFNSAFTVLAGGNALSDLLTGALVLVRRSLFFVPEGVKTSQTNSSLSVTVNTGSVAYFYQDGSGVQVSGDPRFWGAKTYSGNPRLGISVTGNAGGTGVVLTGGTVNGDLTTTMIDAIRFESGSSFTGTVTATAPRPITLRDGVRGLKGVTLTAPGIVLANDVEVDAGSGDASFGGTVDAAQAGKQSLSVTALGTTTFAGAVGGTAALRTLLTQGIAPVAITQSESTRTIPLHFLPWAENPITGANQVKYGIDVALGDNPSQVYEFDTGGNGFFAGYNKPFWQGVPITSDPVSILFTSGNQFNAVVATPTVTVGTGAQTVTTQPIAVGAILSGSSPKTGVFDFTDPAAPPVEGNFFGDFGASLAVLPVSGTSFVLTNPLLQLPGSLSNGYLVQLGPIGITPQVTVGLTDELRAQFPYAVPITPAAGGGTYPVSGWPELNVFGIAPSYFAQESPSSAKIPIEPDGCTSPANCALPTIVDSGAPSMSIRLGTQTDRPFAMPNGQMMPNITFIAEFPTAEGKQPLTWTFLTGDNGSVNQISYADKSAAFAADNLNTGLNIYNFYDVIFDVQDQVLRLRETGAQASVVANSVTTTGAQTYRQNAELSGNYVTGGGAFSVAGVTTLDGDTTVDTGAGDVTFSGTVDGGHALTVKSSGATLFTRSVGGLQPLKSLTTDAGGSTNTFQVTTTNTQNYGDDVILHGQYVAQNGSFLVSGHTTLATGVSVQTNDVNAQNPAQAGGITFSGTIDGESGRAYPLTLISASGKVVLAGAVGSTNPLGGLTVESSAPNGTNPTFVASGRITMDGSLGFANDDGLVIGEGITTKLTTGGLITNFAGEGILVQSMAGSQISNFAVSGSGTANIAVDGAANVAISNNAVSGGTGDGLKLKNSQVVTVTDNSIRGAGGAGISAKTVGTVTISNNDVTANSGNGIDLDQSTDVTISGNTINTNGVSGGLNGIFSKGSTTIQITSNTISGNGFNGVSIGTASTGNAILNNAIFGNNASDNGGLGISLNKGAGNGGQESPRDVQVAPTGLPVIIISGKLNTKDYTGQYIMQVFYTPGTDPTLAEGQQFVGQKDVSVSAGNFSFSLPFNIVAQLPGFITVTATPEDGALNTSEFSNAAAI